MSNRSLAITGLIALLTISGLVILLSPDRTPAGRGELGVTALLGSQAAAAGYQRADPAYRPTLPRDHGTHPDFRSEWWYFTGNLAAAQERRFGFQLTFFRLALAPDDTPRMSDWATRQTWMAHFALTDVTGRRFYREERFARGAVGLAGAQATPFRVWLEDWSAASIGTSTFPLRLGAAAADFAIDLTLRAGRPPVLQGADGYSAKGPGPGNASHYYSYTRLPVTGTVRLDDTVVSVRGDAWLDREWSTSALGPGVEGWDWFALQLDDGRDLMFYRLRRSDGSSDPFSAGTLVAPAGGVTRLDAAGVELEVREHWRSAATGATYPVAWSLDIPAERLRLEIEPWLEEQEMDLSVRYWEGAIRATGTSDGKPVAGLGYLEMTGYGG
jgi:predicted secreted hydrolase